MYLQRILFFIAFFSSVVAIAYLFYAGRGEHGAAERFSANIRSLFWNTTGEKGGLEANALEKGIVPSSSPTEFSHENGRYINATYSFSFALGPEYTARASSADEGGVVFTFDAKEEQGFQIFVIPHDEPAINEDRIKIDLPDITIKHVRTGMLDSAEVLVFNSFDSSLGETYEVWFVHNNNLYQIMTYAHNVGTLNGILDSWKF